MNSYHLEEIYKLYFQDVYLFVLRMSRNKEIAEDITSETFMKAMDSLDRFRGDCNIKVWLCQIAKNCYFHHLEKKENGTYSLEDYESQDILNIEEQIIDLESSGEIFRILHTLDEPYKEVFLLRTFCELDFKHIGEIFGKSDNWACVTYHRAKKKIQDLFGGSK